MDCCLLFCDAGWGFVCRGTGAWDWGSGFGEFFFFLGGEGGVMCVCVCVSVVNRDGYENSLWAGAVRKGFMRLQELVILGVRQAS